MSKYWFPGIIMRIDGRINGTDELKIKFGGKDGEKRRDAKFLKLKEQLEENTFIEFGDLFVNVNSVISIEKATVRGGY